MATGPKITLRDLPMAVRQAGTTKLPGGVSPTEAFGEKASPLDLHEREEIDRPGARSHGRQRQRRCQKARHQPPHAASKNQRDEPDPSLENHRAKCERHGSSAWGMRE